MSPQADYVVSNGTGAAVRSDINGQLAAIVSNNSGASAPATTYAYMLWADTSTNLLKLRNGANSAWITVGDLTAANLGLATLASPTFTGTATIPTLTVSTAANIPLGSAASPTLYFTGDSNTGLYSPGADQVALSTGGTGRLFIDSSGRCGIGTSTVDKGLIKVNGSNGTSGGLSCVANFVTGIAGSAAIAVGSAGDGRLDLGFDGTDAVIGNGGNYGLRFLLNSGERVRFTADGKVGIGSTSIDSSAKLAVSNGGAEGLEFQPGVASGVCGITSYNRSGSAYTSIRSDAADHRYLISGSEKARLDSSGRWLLGTSTSNSSFDSALQIAGSGTGGTQLVSRFDNNVSGPYLYLSKSRGVAAGTHTIVQNGDEFGSIDFKGANGSAYDTGARITAYVDGTPGASGDMPGRLVFSTTADGASSPTERMRITSAGTLFCQGVYDNTTSVAANVFVNTNGNLARSTSSIKYKTNIETIGDQYADAILNCRPVWYQSTCQIDNPNWGYWGFIAEEVAEIDPRLCFFKEEEDGTLEPEGVQYDRFVPHLLNLIKRQKEQIEAMEARLTALESA